MLTRIKNLQTRDCFYPVYKLETATELGNPGYYFYDDEFLCDDCVPDSYHDLGYFGPYASLDEVCKQQYRHYKSTMSL